MRQPSTRELGNAAEDVARTHLETAGLVTIDRNFHCKMGEIDLIMSDGKTLVFVEVRLRQNRNHASGAESVTSAKQRRIIRTAELYRVTHPQVREMDCRFDVVSMGPSIDWIQNAFTLD